MCQREHDSQDFWVWVGERSVRSEVCPWCRGENHDSYWPVPFSVIDKMPCLPDWDEDPDSTRYSELVLVYYGSTKTDGTVVDFEWSTGKLRQYRHNMQLDWSVDAYPYFDDSAGLWQVSHWMPMPPAPKGSENYVVPEFLKLALQEHLDLHKR